jgi:hypothetical protein
LAACSTELTADLHAANAVLAEIAEIVHAQEDDCLACAAEFWVDETMRLADELGLLDDIQEDDSKEVA